jgi:hypothetical protein
MFGDASFLGKIGEASFLARAKKAESSMGDADCLIGKAEESIWDAQEGSFWTVCKGEGVTTASVSEGN